MNFTCLTREPESELCGVGVKSNALAQICIDLFSICNLDRILYSVEFPSVLK